MEIHSIYLLVGIIVNIAATIGGLYKIQLSNERRFTALETHMLYLGSKQKTGGKENE